MSARRISVLFLLGFIAVSSVSAQTPDAGVRVFVGRCAGCHGGDGNGGELAPGHHAPASPPIPTRNWLR